MTVYFMGEEALQALWGDMRAEMDAHQYPASNITGTISSDNLPSYVDDVIEGYYHQGAFYGEAAHTTAITGEAGKIYVDLSTDSSYRWSGSAYVSISNPIDIATQAEAEAGSDNAKMMTPLRVAQAMASGAYVLAPATASSLGGVKPDGTTITVDQDGTIHGTSTYALPAATMSSLGGVKPDGTTITADQDGTIHGASTMVELTVSEVHAITGYDGTWAEDVNGVVF